MYGVINSFFKGNIFMITSNKQSAHRMRIFLVGSVALTLLGIAFRIINLLFFYDDGIGYYSEEAMLPQMMNVFFVLSCVFFAFGSLFFTDTSDSEFGTEKNLASRMISSLCIVALVAFLALSYVRSLELRSDPTIFDLILFVSAVTSIVYFIFNLLRKLIIFQSLLSIGTSVLLVYMIAYSYFDVYTPMNSPNKILLHLSCLSAMIFFISEARCMVGSAKKKLYVFSLCCSVFFAGTSSVCIIPLYLAGKITNYSYILFDLVMVAFFVYFVFRLIMLIKAPICCEEICAAEAELPEDATDLSADEEIPDTDNDLELEPEQSFDDISES